MLIPTVSPSNAGGSQRSSTPGRMLRRITPRWTKSGIGSATCGGIRGSSFCFHNASFDLMVAERHLGLPLPPWHRIHDTRFLLSYVDPYSNDYSLKASAQRLLGVQAEQSDQLREWIVSNIPEAHRQPKQWAAYIAQAPGKLVEPYACGDVERTEQLFKLLVRALPGTQHARCLRSRSAARADSAAQQSGRNYS